MRIWNKKCIKSIDAVQNIRYLSQDGEIWSRPSLKYMFGNGYGSVKTLSLQQNWIRKILSCAVSLINKATISFFGSGVWVEKTTGKQGKKFNV